MSAARPRPVKRSRAKGQFRRANVLERSGPRFGRSESALSAVTKIAIDKQPRQSENREHEESWTGALPALTRLRSQEADGRANPSSHPKPASSTHRRTHRALRNNRTGKCQHRHLQLRARENRNRFKNRPHHAGLQADERRKIDQGRVVCRPHAARFCPPPAFILIDLYSGKLRFEENS